MRALKGEARFWAHVLFALDCALIALVWSATHVLPFDGLRPAGASFQSFLPALLLVPPVWAGVFAGLRLYRLRRTERRLAEFARCVWGSALVGLGLVSVGWLVLELELSRLFVVVFWLLNAVGLYLLRAAFRELLRFARRINLHTRRVVVVGTGRLGRFIHQKLWLHPELGTRFLGFITEDEAELGSVVAGAPVLGHVDQLDELTREHSPDQVFLCQSPTLRGRIEDIVRELEEQFLEISLVPEVDPGIVPRGRIEEFEGLPVIALAGSPIQGWGSFAKRGVDVVVSAAVLLFASPLLALIAILIKLTSRGPVLYSQERLGFEGRTFMLMKFRTMVQDAEQAGVPVWSRRDDPRCTRIGQFLRWTSLDELPQLWQVLRGEMSLVGPRPERPVFIDRFRETVPGYMQRHRVKAGVTGWAQVNGWRGDTSLTERVRHDLYYIENWSILLDLKILVKTGLGGFLNRSA